MPDIDFRQYELPIWYLGLLPQGHQDISWQAHLQAAGVELFVHILSVSRSSYSVDDGVCGLWRPSGEYGLENATF